MDPIEPSRIGHLVAAIGLLMATGFGSFGCSATVLDAPLGVASMQGADPAGEDGGSSAHWQRWPLLAGAELRVAPYASPGARDAAERLASGELRGRPGHVTSHHQVRWETRILAPGVALRFDAADPRALGVVERVQAEYRSTYLAAL